MCDNKSDISGFTQVYIDGHMTLAVSVVQWLVTLCSVSVQVGLVLYRQ